MEQKTEKIKKIEKIPYKGYLYNLTTETGNLLANNILVKNSGGLGTPAFERVLPGMVHRANGGVLYIDEIGNLQPVAQQELLTALQEKKFPITCRTERSSGASVVTTPAPCIPENETITVNNKKTKVKEITNSLKNPTIIKIKNTKLIIPKENFKIDSDQKTSEIILFYERDYSGKLIEIEFMNGEKIRLTPEHPILLQNNQFIEAKKLKIGDDVKTK